MKSLYLFKCHPIIILGMERERLNAIGSTLLKKEEQKEREKKDTAELYDMLTEPNC